MPWQRGLLEVDVDVSRYAIAMSELELGHQIERIGAGWKLTKKGLAAARWLDSQRAAPSS
jgi:hypothetical protein